MSNVMNKVILDIKEDETEEYCWEINVPTRSRLKANLRFLEDSDMSVSRLAKTGLKFDTGIMEDIENSGEFHFNSTTIFYSLRLPQTHLGRLISLQNCTIEFYIQGHILKSFNTASISKEIIGPSKRDPTTYVRWFGQYDPTEHNWNDSVVKIKICFLIQIIRGGNLVHLSSLMQKNITDMEIEGETTASANFFQSKFLSDVIFECDGVDFPSHRFLLSSKSPVFCRMFQEDSQMKEVTEGRIIITDIKPHILKEFLRFLYCASVKNLGVICKELIYVADKYDVKQLKDRCEKSLMAQLTPENAAEIYTVAETLRIGTLLKKAVQVMKANKSKVFQDSTHLLEFTQRYPEAMFLLFNSL